MQKTNLAELRRLHQAAAFASDEWDDSAKGIYNALPVLLDELEAAREKMAELKSERDAAVLIIKMDGHATDYALGLLDARDRRMKLLGAAEWIEKTVSLGRDEGLNHLDIGFSYLLEIAAQLRREAEENG